MRDKREREKGRKKEREGDRKKLLCRSAGERKINEDKENAFHTGSNLFCTNHTVLWTQNPAICM